MQAPEPLQSTAVGWDAVAASVSTIAWRELFTTNFAWDAIELSGIKKRAPPLSGVKICLLTSSPRYSVWSWRNGFSSFRITWKR